MKTIHQHVQWEIRVADDGSYEIMNPGPKGEQRFYTIVSGQYGEPILVPEPELAVPVPSGCNVVDMKGDPFSPDQKISGIICRDSAGSVKLRVSLTNAKAKGIKWTLHEDGRLEVDGAVFYLVALVLKDAKRIRNYDAFFNETAPEGSSVRFYELEDLPV